MKGIYQKFHPHKMEYFGKSLYSFSMFYILEYLEIFGNKFFLFLDYPKINDQTVREKLRCVIKCYFHDFDEVYPNREKNDV